VLPTETARAPRSTFISGMAWFGIVSGALATLGFCSFLLSQPGIAAVVGFLSGAATLATSVGLRKRREWARLGFIGILGYSIAMSFVGVWSLRMPNLSEMAAAGGAPPPGISQEQLDALASAMRPAALVGALVVGFINALIIAKLCTRRVREEFGAASAA
jgi:hypothetical protein